MKVAVIGCGAMGIRIAGELAYHGHRVKITDNDVRALNNVYERLQEDKMMLHSEKLMPHKNFIGQILCMSQLEETVSDAEVIFEVVKENLNIKQDLFERISHLCKPSAIIATNTLCLNITDIVERTLNKERTIGLRFLFPVYYIPEVEIMAGRHTSPDTIEKVRIMLEKMGKTLFFRSGGFPLILSEDERDKRKQARLEQIQSLQMKENTIPALSHRGNVTPRVHDDDAMVSSEAMDRDCAICMDRLRNCLLQPCHHMVTCYECSKMLHNRKDGCPICRKDINSIIKVYHS
ncbi:3-hydroxybutyryl-CoA dehydrogenase-like [Haliotis rufescens]|uniref:3-hydroxybutyryl-CoA dehydrogenase-like n=1 Tax=Haliotis rufescens TaxID=6454 RepID=UPI00201F8EAA|nr:3-hydroxybutyryl-CoA dehydrogenase-like [Haliotis rufescens]